MAYARLIEKAGQLANSFIKRQNALLSKHQTWSQDVRVVVFSRSAHSLQSTQLGMIFYEQGVIQTQFWQQVGPQLTLQNAGYLP